MKTAPDKPPAPDQIFWSGAGVFVCHHGRKRQPPSESYGFGGGLSVMGSIFLFVIGGLEFFPSTEVSFRWRLVFHLLFLLYRVRVSP